ncbi:uncharacterized protein BO95DRAFT_427963 [Aspergillus brunneoviolaceus CBS 621.78]|uniref:Uncharacterized protein n=1 Tax=Aspergillus brunneoviolaceus CBS 621.78 TaxID=1450534 RepID=A0ACD1GLM8_9EURO|nr:hypothetical protein BO95DRAFT_427963 [Aspergillus brunneoviolaceus CBS 621.78]RAH50043.1 hypothetical protein BO95DRAFT_427963 [Aspergillus brunneoviolaceus CBS 621.78]
MAWRAVSSCLAFEASGLLAGCLVDVRSSAGTTIMEGGGYSLPVVRVTWSLLMGKIDSHVVSARGKNFLSTIICGVLRLDIGASMPALADRIKKKRVSQLAV